MLQAILKAKEQQLTKKAQQRLHWWSRHRLRSLILVVPPLKKEVPLWSYNEESLACARLCGLTVIELQNLLRVYWEKPAWKRWLLYWFTSPSVNSLDLLSTMYHFSFLESDCTTQ